MAFSPLQGRDFGPQTAYLKQLFANFPEDAALSVIYVEAGGVFIRQDDTCNTVYVLAEGRARSQIYTHGATRAFADFEAVTLFGEYETVAGLPHYRADVTAQVDCVCLKLSAADYTRWMLQDSKVFYARMRGVLQTLLWQGEAERSSQQLPGRERIVLFLLDYCQRHNHGGEVVVRKTRTAVVEETGFSLRTVNRAVQQLAREGLLTLVRGKIVITPAQRGLLQQEWDGLQK